MQYRIVKSGTKYILETEVTRLIQQGWVPQGGVSFWERGGLSYKEVWVQAMVKPEPKK